MNEFVYDIETYVNVFTITVEHADAPIVWQYECSDWRDDSAELIRFLAWIRESNGRMIGFNNLGFDYPIMHMVMRMGRGDARVIYDKAQAIIGSQNDADRWLHSVKPSDRIIPQVDLYKIHHFDNKARATSLKALEFNMRADTIEDLPFPVGTMLTRDQVPVLRRYNAHDVKQTKVFYTRSRDMIEFREKLCTMYPDRDWINFNDTKIGKEYFVMRLETAGVSCYDYGPDGRQPRQTLRPVIHLKDAILPWIQFEQPEFQRVLNWLKQQSITETRGVFKDLVATVNGMDYVFGLGGIHSSVENRVIESDDEHAIIDLDVSSYYPNLAIVNGFYPEHLGLSFGTIYKNLYEQRKQYSKKSSESAMLKLALNGVYGDSNSRFSVFYDPLFTMRITLNGQLLLCMMVEQLMKVSGLTVIQTNTDGVTVRVPRAHLPLLDQVTTWWQQRTMLTLESATYTQMFVRDVNTYIARYEHGGIKRKGAYEHQLGWHQDASALVVPKVAEKVLLDGAPIRQTVESWQDLHDFMLRIKVPRSSHLLWGDQRIQNTSRYYVAKSGKSLTKVMPPLKGKTDWRRFAVESGWDVQVCNDIKDAVLPVDYEYYIKEVEKLVLCLN